MRATARLASRRRVLKGMLGGAAVSVGLPFLDSFLNDNGTALAGTGAPLPIRFGTWLWGMGLCPGRWEPKQVGAGYEMPHLLRSLTRFKDRISVISGMRVDLEGRTLVPHMSGVLGCCAGEVSQNRPSIDTLVADAIGSSVRFRSLEVAASRAANAGGDNPNTISRRSANLVNPSEASPAALYARIFGPDFQDPKAAEFKPDPQMMARRSVLSAIKEPRESLMKSLGATDRARLDEYFTSLRQLEQQVELQLRKPEPLDACVVPAATAGEAETTTDIDAIAANHRMLVGLLAHAMACDQTRVINIWFSMGEMRRPSDSKSHHIFTHEEPIDEKLGYQPTVAWYEERQMENFAEMLRILDSIKEGEGTLLDHSLLYAFSEHGYARRHDLENIPMFLAGRAGGRLKPGAHIVAKGDPVTRVGLTIQQAMRLPVDSWGTGTMQTSKALTEILA